MATTNLHRETRPVEALTNQSDETRLIKEVRGIGPIITAHGEEAEREGRLPKPVREAMLEAGLLRMLTPRSLGGFEVDPATYACVLEEVAGYDSAAGWTLANPLVFAFRCAWLPDDGAEEIFGSGNDVLIAAGVNPPLKAVPVEGGYRLTGRTPFVSNCHDANWFGANAIVMDGEQPRQGENGKLEEIRVYVPMDTCRIIDTWSVMGMRGTGSDDVEVSDVFVPSRRTYPLGAGIVRGSHYQGLLYRFPLSGVGAGGVALAIARNAINEVSALAQGKKPLTSRTLLRDKASTQRKLAKAEAGVRSARTFRNQTISDIWGSNVIGNPTSLEQKADLMLATVNAVSSSVEAVELMYEVAGTSGFLNNGPMQRHFRDIQVLKQHASASEARYESIGQVYLGLTSDFPALRS